MALDFSRENETSTQGSQVVFGVFVAQAATQELTAPLMEDAIHGDNCTLRGTVDIADEGLFSCLTMELDDHNARQIYLRMNRSKWIALMNMGEQAVRTIDRALMDEVTYE